MRGIGALSSIALLVVGSTVFVQAAAGQASVSVTQPVAEMVSLNFPDNVELKILIDYVSQ